MRKIGIDRGGSLPEKENATGGWWRGSFRGKRTNGCNFTRVLHAAQGLICQPGLELVTVCAIAFAPVVWEVLA